MNILSNQTETIIADYLKILGSPYRIQILFNIGYGEACVCHLEAVLHKRQAFISQHLMVMRDAGILETRRDGKYIYYRIADERLFEVLRSAAAILNISEDQLPDINESDKHPRCDCPNCLPETITNQI